MDNLEKELGRLERKANLTASVDEVEKALATLKNARASIEAGTEGLCLELVTINNTTPRTDGNTAQKSLLTAHNSVKQNFERMNENLKDIHNGMNKYGKAIRDRFKDKQIPFAEEDTLEPIASQPSLINRAIAMHLLREGLFDVASTFISEANAAPGGSNTDTVQRPGSADAMDTSMPPSTSESWTADFSPASLKSTALQQHFSSMYQILDAMRSRADLGPAIAWARTNAGLLDARGSTLEFDLCRLQFVLLYKAAGPLAALRYARDTFPAFPGRYAAQARQLAGALAFAPSIGTSPYAGLFAAADADDAARGLPNDATAAAASAFTAEFCALLSLASASPLFTAVTAGCVALPTLAKFAAIARQVGTSWTTSVELPVEVDLPPAFVFHSVFVCPVSKDQATDANPPMRMPCGHVVARESLESMSSGRRFKCPYCPGESTPSDAMRIYL